MEGVEDATQSLLEALGHPIRRRILREMANRTSPTSPTQLSNTIEETLSNVSYHCRVLAQNGVIELVATRPVRGSMQHFYAVSIEAGWAQELLGIDGDAPAAPARGEEVA